MKKQLKEIREIRKQKYLDEFLHQFEKDGVGIPISDIKNPEMFGNEEYGTIVDGSEDTSIEKFAETDYISVYKYETIPGEGPDIIETSREFCKRMMRTDRVYTREQISNLQNMNGSNVFEWRGSYNCRVCPPLN